MDANQDVFWFDISVHDMFLVQVLQSCCHLCNVLSSLPLRKPILFPEVLVELSLAGKL